LSSIYYGVQNNIIPAAAINVCLELS